jgi:hypothetical protein
MAKGGFKGGFPGGGSQMDMMRKAQKMQQDFPEDAAGAGSEKI